MSLKLKSPGKGLFTQGPIGAPRLQKGCRNSEESSEVEREVEGRSVMHVPQASKLTDHRL